MKASETNLARETRFAKSLYGDLSKPITAGAQRIDPKAPGADAQCEERRGGYENDMKTFQRRFIE